MIEKELIADLLSALEYHTEQTRPIEFSKVAIEAAREHLRKPAQQKPVNLRRGDLLRCIETDELCTVWATSPTGNTLIKWSANNFGNYTAEQIGELFWLEPAQQEFVSPGGGYVPAILAQQRPIKTFHGGKAWPVQEPAQQERSDTRPCRSCDGTGERFTGIDEAPTSICKPCKGTGQIALAEQPAPVQQQSCYCPNCEVMSKELAELKKHKPVAWMDADGNFSDNNDHRCFPIPLYTIARPTPPAQRTWVGLTDEDDIDWEEGGNLRDLVKAIEAKLRSKNA